MAIPDACIPDSPSESTLRCLETAIRLHKENGKWLNEYYAKHVRNFNRNHPSSSISNIQSIKGK